jgi:hypothetical protein
MFTLGALAQLAAAYYYQYAPVLVTLATPATGNVAFCRQLDRTAIPHGGIRLWNEADVVPLLANLVSAYATNPMLLFINFTAGKVKVVINVQQILYTHLRAVTICAFFVRSLNALFCQRLFIVTNRLVIGMLEYPCVDALLLQL